MNELEFKLLSDSATIPVRERLDAGFDIFASEDIVLSPQEKALVSTDIAINIPEGYVGLLTSRSGISSKTNLVIETGKIDAGYQGHMKINVKNDMDISNVSPTKAVLNGERAYSLLDVSGERIGFLTNMNCYKIQKGDKLAQLVIVPIWTPELKQVEEFNEKTNRGTDGFGSTGYTI